jgi:hypothetical protein
LARSMASRGRGMPVTRGLAPMDAVAGTMISYATKDGTEASDGDGPHSPYTNALLSEIATPGLEVGLMLRRVRERVMRATNDKQVPWDYGSLLGEFYFTGQPLPNGQAVAVTEMPRPAAANPEAKIASRTPEERTAALPPPAAPRPPKPTSIGSVVYLTSQRGMGSDSSIIFGAGKDLLTNALTGAGFPNLDIGNESDGKALAETGQVKNSLANHRYIFLVSMAAADNGTHPLNDKIHNFTGVTSLRVYDSTKKMFIYNKSTSGNRVDHSPESGAANAIAAAADSLSKEIAADVSKLDK